METNNILTGDIDVLREFKELVERNVNAANQVEYLSDEEKRLDKDINAGKKILKDNIDAVIKKRRSDVTDKFEEAIKTEEGKLRKIKDKRAKAKEKGVKERIGDETADFKSQNKELKGTIKNVIKENKVPKLCDSGFYMSLFFPKGMKDAMICAGVILITCLLLPGALYLLLPVDYSNKILSGILLAVVYFVVIAFFVFLYVFIAGRTKKQYESAISEIKKLRECIDSNNKQIKKLTRAIKRDNNEELYGLENFDEKIEEIENEIKRINAEKENALYNFENNVKPDIISQLESKELPRIEELERKHKENIADREQMEAVVKETSLKITSEYEAYIGKAYSNREKIDALLEIMEAGKAKTIAEAIEIYKNQP